jgi:hypothetical protein
MSPNRVLHHVDKSVADKIKNGQRWDDILYYLEDNIKRYKKRDSYIRVSERYLVNNWDRIQWKKRMTTMLVIQYSRRVDDINWIKKNHQKFPQFGSLKMYKMISLKDKLKINVINQY